MFALHEIIEALNRRGPQIERAGDSRIARDALMLRREAVERLEELKRAEAAGCAEDLVEATSTHDWRA